MKSDFPQNSVAACSRRNFLRLMGAGTASALTAALPVRADLDSEPIQLFDGKNLDEMILSACSNGSLVPLGKLKTKRSLEIPASRFSIGCECLDRKMWDFEKVLPHLANLGAKWARVQTGWSQCEKTKGQYDFTWLDKIVDPLLAAGVRPWFNVGYGNRHYIPEAPHETAVGWAPIFTATAREGWLRFVHALTAHYKNRVSHFEVWNEPDGEYFWTPQKPSPELYTELVAITSKAIREVCPNSVVIGGAIADIFSPGGIDYVERCFISGMGEHIQAFTYHLYAATPEGWSEKRVGAVRALIKHYAPHVELWQGESGAVSKAQPGQALGEGNWDEFKQAKCAARRTLLDLVADLPFTSYFHASDFMFYIVKSEVVHKRYYFGLVGGDDYKPKPAYFAYQTLCSLFAGKGERSEDLDLKLSAREKADQPEVWDARCHGFTTPQGPIIAYWSPRDLMKEFKPRPVSISLWARKEFTFADAVLIDPITQQVFSVAQHKVTAGSHRFSDLPLVDWPLLLAPRSAIQLR